MGKVRRNQGLWKRILEAVNFIGHFHSFAPMSLNKPELARLFFRELSKVHDHTDWTPIQKADALARLLELLFLEVTKQDNISFTTLFARIAYACQKMEVSKRTQYWIHFFRKKTRSHIPPEEEINVFALGMKALATCIAGLFDEAVPDELVELLPKKIPFDYAETEIKAFQK